MKDKISVEEAKRLRNELSNNIFELLKKFEKATDTEVDNIHLLRMQEMGGSYLANLTVEVKL